MFFLDHECTVDEFLEVCGDYPHQLVEVEKKLESLGKNAKFPDQQKFCW